MTSPLVSVVMPVFNGEKFLSQAIESILNQTYKNFEFLIIDDCSTDRSFEIIKKYAKKDKRINYYKNKKNLNQSKTIKRAINLIKGKYFVKVDQDDISNSERIEKQTGFLENNSDWVVVGSQLRIINEKNEVLGYRIYPLIDKEVRRALFFKSPFAYPATCIRTKILKKINYPTIFNYCDDYLLWFILLKFGKGANIDNFLLNYRLTKDQVKIKKLKDQLKETIEVQKTIFKDFKESKKVPFLAYINHFLLKLLYFLPNKLVLELFKFFEFKKF